jgi:hypothetical protein
VLANVPSLVLFRRGNLAMTLLMTGETREARRLLTDNWASPAPDCANTTPGIAFLGLLADLLDGGNAAGEIGRLKTLLLGPKPPIAAGVAYQWGVGYLLDTSPPPARRRPIIPHGAVGCHQRSRPRARARSVPHLAQHQRRAARRTMA